MNIKTSALYCYNTAINRNNTFINRQSPVNKMPADIFVMHTSKSLSFEGAIKRNSIDFYNALSNFDKQNLSLKSRDVLSAYEEGYPLLNPNHMKEMLGISKEIANRYKNDIIVGLGRSPLWILEAAKNMKNGIDDYVFVPFSRYDFYEEEFCDGAFWHSKEDCVNCYREFLRSVGLDPKSIVKNSENGKKTVIVDYIHSGHSMQEFLSLIKKWRVFDKDVESKLDDSILVHDITTLADDKNIPSYSFKVNSKSLMSDQLAKLTTCSHSAQDSPGFSYPIEKWLQFPPDKGKSGNNSKYAEFLILEHLDNYGLLKNGK